VKLTSEYLRIVGNCMRECCARASDSQLINLLEKILGNLRGMTILISVRLKPPF